jgi:hypothetical protein
MVTAMTSDPWRDAVVASIINEQKKAKPKRDVRLVASIVNELKGDGSLKDPRRPPPADDQTPLEAHAAQYVQNSINTIRWLQTYKSPVPVTKIKDIRKAARLLRNASATLSKFAFTPAQRLAVPEMLRISKELDTARAVPPERADPLKYWCASEAFDLMDFMSAKPPTGYENGPFQTIAAMLYEAVTGKPPASRGVDMKRSADLVLRDRR